MYLDLSDFIKKRSLKERRMFPRQGEVWKHASWIWAVAYLPTYNPELRYDRDGMLPSIL